MGEFTGDYKQGENLQGDNEVKQGDDENKISTDVEDVFADGEKDGAPVFKVSSQEFFNNMKQDRRRLRFKSGTSAQQYHRNTKYRRPFWIQDAEKGYLRKIK